MIKSNYDIIIAGAGITGLTMSILLNRSGYKVAVIEKTNLNNLKAGESFTPDTKKLFELIGFDLKKKSPANTSGIVLPGELKIYLKIISSPTPMVMA